MTLKYALFGLPRGGAKAGIRLNGGLSSDERRAALMGFGRQLGPLIRAGLYSPGMDMNCGPEDLRTLYQGAGLQIGKPTDTSLYTAVSAANAIQGCADALRPDEPIRISIEGFGSVCRHLITMLPPRRFRIVAISTVVGAIANPERGFSFEDLARARDRYGDALVRNLEGGPIPPEELHRFPVDFFVPSARTGSIAFEPAASYPLLAIIPVANAPYQPGAARALHESGIVVLPGYLCNAGGVVGSTLADQGVPPTQVHRLFAARFRPLIRAIVTTCARRGLSPVEAVEGFASELARERDRVIPRSLARRIHDRAGRRLPRAVRRRTARRRFDAALSRISAHFAEPDAP
jgi:glutamate dehydrogenase/leucine dehydrogenase